MRADFAEAQAVLANQDIVEQWWNFPPFNDEPKYWHLAARLSRLDAYESDDDTDDTGSVAGASSLDLEAARIRLAGEAAERFALRPLEPSEVTEALTSLEIAQLGPAIALDQLVCGRGQLPKNDARVQWTQGIDAVSGNALFVPTQLVLVPHVFRANESVLRPPISTGAAAHTVKALAAENGLLECIERDAFMFAWYRQIELKEILPEDPIIRHDEQAASRFTACSRYRLTPRLFLLPTDLPDVTVAMCVLVDDTGGIPSASVSAKASRSASKAVVGAIDEANQIRCWLRRVSLNSPGVPTLPLNRLHDRALYWLQPEPVKHLTEWISRARPATLKTTSPEAALTTDADPKLAKHVENVAGRVVAIDLTERLPKACRQAGWHASKVVVPGLQPLNLTDTMEDLIPSRLCSAREGVPEIGSLDELHRSPHPFM